MLGNLKYARGLSSIVNDSQSVTKVRTTDRCQFSRSQAMCSKEQLRLTFVGYNSKSEGERVYYNRDPNCSNRCF